MKKIVFSTFILISGLASAQTPINGWYSNIFGGFSQFPNNIDTIDYIHWHHLKYHMGYDVGGSIGFKSNPLRYEGQFTYLNAEVKRFGANDLTFTRGEASAALLMANVYYDFPDMVPGIAPYIGGGIGYGYVNVRLATGSPYNVYLDVNDNVFTYQGTAGLTYNYRENYAINIDYRYIGTSRAGNFGKTFQANLAEVGVTYRFDGWDYK